MAAKGKTMVLSKEWTEKIQVLIVVLVVILYLFYRGTRPEDDFNQTSTVAPSQAAITESPTNVTEALRSTTMRVLFQPDGRTN